MRSIFLPLLILFAACGPRETLCESHFSPYPDAVSGRVRTAENAALLDGMSAYARGDFSAAVPALSTYLAAKEHDGQARLYLAVSSIAIGEPFQAELQLDFMDREDVNSFNDQIEWYRALCLVCSDQHDRALQAATAIASSERHTYKAEAAHLMEDLLHE